MKKTLVILLISLISLAVHAQDYKDSDYYYYDGVENRGDMGISSEQRRKIIEIKKSIGRRHSEIGRNRSLRGYEKGQAHRDLNQKVRKEIDEVLNSSQRSDWDKGLADKDSKIVVATNQSSESFTDWNKKYDAIEDDIDALENKIDDMEDFYEDRIDAVENDRSLSKSEMKAKKNALKAEMKAKKREMKSEKQAMKNARYH